MYGKKTDELFERFITAMDENNTDMARGILDDISSLNADEQIALVGLVEDVNSFLENSEMERDNDFAYA